MVRRIFVAVLLIAAMTVNWPMPGGADLGSDPFAAIGTVVDNDVPVDGVEGTGFLLGSLTETSTTADAGVDENGNLTVSVSPATSYFKAGPSGSYTRSNFSSTVQNGAEMRVHGRRVFNEAGEPQFVAQVIWSPPPPPDDTPGRTLPKCGEENGMSNQAYRFIATVQSRRVNVPCTGIGDQPGGFSLRDLELVAPPISSAGVEAYGGVPQIYTTAATNYYRYGVPSNFDKVVLTGEQVQVDGRYQYLNGAWVFVATRVWSPPADASIVRFNIDEALSAIEMSPGVYEGRSRGGVFFGGGQFKANLTWTPTLTGWAVSGTWNLRNTITGDRIDGTLSGVVTGLSLKADVSITSGIGRFAGANGTGTLDGSVVAADLTQSPTAFDAHLLGVVTVN